VAAAGERTFASGTIGLCSWSSQMTISLTPPTARSTQASSIPGVRLGAHVSGGGLKGIPSKAASIGCEGVQIFASSPQMWRPPSCKPAEAEAFRAACAEASLGSVAVHAIYLVNPAAESDEHREKTVVSLVKTLEAAEMLGASVVVTHLGSSKGSTKAEALARSCRTFGEILTQYSGPVRLLFETSAGAGETMGGTFDELGEMIRTIGAPANLGACIDTAHIFTAGYDLRTADDLERTLETFDRHVGLDKLGAVHLNDSKAPFGSNKDRHENIGDGEIGAEALGRFIRHPALGTTPLYLEVPGYSKEGPDRPNMERIFDLAGRAFPLPPLDPSEVSNPDQSAQSAEEPAPPAAAPKARATSRRRKPAVDA
jgi:deoxyribonuclease-4